MGIGENVGENIGRRTGISNAILSAMVPWKRPADEYEPAKLPLEIMSPQEGLTTGVAAPSPWYRIRVGMVFERPMGVKGGAAPLHYEIVTGPFGTTIGANKGDEKHGVFTVPGQPEGSYILSVKVTDQNDATDTHTWLVTSTNANSMVLDAVGGDDATGMGTEANPYQTMHAWLETAKNSSSFTDWHIYYRDGTYYTDYSYDATNPVGGMSLGNAKPGVHIGWPGESMLVDYAGNGTTHLGGSFFWTGSPSDTAAINQTWQGVCSNSSPTYWQAGWRCAGMKRLCTYNLTVGNQAGPGVSGSNPAWFLYGKTNSLYEAQYNLFHTVIINDLENYMFLEIYDVDSMWLENITVKNDVSGNNRLIYFKELSRNSGIRYVTGIEGLKRVHLIQVGASTGLYDEIECGWCNWKISDATYYVVIFGCCDTTSPIGNNYLYRCNITGGAIDMHRGGGGGDVELVNNVREYGSGTDGGGGIVENSLNLTYSVTGDIVGISGSGIVDGTTNLLTAASRAAWLYKRGSELRPL